MLVDCLEDMLKPMTAMYYEQDETKKVRVNLFSDLSFFKNVFVALLIAPDMVYDV